MVRFETFLKTCFNLSGILKYDFDKLESHCKVILFIFPNSSFLWLSLNPGRPTLRQSSLSWNEGCQDEHIYEFALVLDKDT